METFLELRPNQLPLNEGVQLLAHNKDGLVALEKPIKVLSHPNRSADISRSLLRAEYDHEQECYNWKDADGNQRKIWLLNRLDSPTSGVILLGLNSEISQTVKSAFFLRKVSKMYYAVVRGKPFPDTGTWTDVLRKDMRNGRRVIRKGRIIPAKCEYQVIKSPSGGFPISLVKFFPATGRTHQLRVQCRKRSLPIVGDRTFGHFGFNREVELLTGHNRLLLHCARTAVPYIHKGQPGTFVAESKLPEAFDEVVAFRAGFKKGVL